MNLKPERTVVGDFPYFLGLLSTLSLGIGVYYIIRNKSEMFKKWFIFGLFAFNFVLHFLKIFNSYYQQRLPEFYATITFDNICAISTILFPFVYISRQKVLKDYMFYMGILSGLAALLYPSGGVLNRAPYAFDYFRFYICHGIIMFGPIYMVAFGFHKLDYKRIWKVPFVLWAVLTIIFINTILLGEIGVTDIRSPNFLNQGYERNASLVFGPTKEFESVIGILYIFVPKFLLTVPFGPFAGQVKCVPLLWLFSPTYIYLVIVAFLMILPIQYKTIKADFKKAAKALRQKFSVKQKQTDSANADAENNAVGRAEE